jgi:hypothetical protein
MNDDSNVSGGEKTEHGSKKKNIIIVFVIIAIVVIGMGGTIIYLLNRKTPSENGVPDSIATEEKREVLVTSENIEDVVEQTQKDIEEYIPPGYYEAQMNYVWHFATGDSPSYDARVRNSASNTNPVYFDVFMADDEEHVIYKSPVIPLGSELNKFTLDEDLEEGTYDCVIKYHLVDDDQNTISTIRFTVTVIVEG